MDSTGVVPNLSVIIPHNGDKLDPGSMTSLLVVNLASGITSGWPGSFLTLDWLVCECVCVSTICVCECVCGWVVVML